VLRGRTGRKGSHHRRADIGHHAERAEEKRQPALSHSPHPRSGGVVHPASTVPRRSRRRTTTCAAETVGASRRTAVFAPVSRCVVSQERRRVKIAPRQFGVFSARFSCAENGAGEKGIGAFLRRCWSRQPAVQAATRDCGVVKMALFSETPEPFDAKFEKKSPQSPVPQGFAAALRQTR